MQRSEPTPILKFDLSQAGISQMSAASNKTLFTILEVCRTQLGFGILKSGIHQYELPSPTAAFPTGKLAFEILNCQFIAFRACLGDTSDYRYDIIASRNIGSGAFGTLYEEVATLIPRCNEYFEVKKSNDVCKISSRGSNQNYDLINLKMRHLHFKPLRYYFDSGNNRIALQRMRRMSGVNLYDHLKCRTRTFIDLLLCAQASLDAIYYQITAKKMIHCDIKLENVIYKATEHACVAHIVDIDFVRSENDTRSALAGTKGYLAPEYLDSGIPSSKSDVYAAGLMLAEIFNGKIKLQQKDNKKSEDELAKMQGIDNKVTGLFDGIPLITEKFKIAIRLLLDAMTHPDGNMRPSIKDAINILMEIIHEYNISVYTANPTELKAAMSSASELVEAINTSPVTNIPDGGGDIRDYLTETLPLKLTQFSNHPDCISVFKSRANVSAFASAQSKLDIIRIASNIVKELRQMQLDMLSKSVELEALLSNSDTDIKASSTALLSHVTSKIKAMYSKYNNTVESISSLTEKYKKEIAKLDKQIQSIYQDKKADLYRKNIPSPTFFKHAPPTITHNDSEENAYCFNRTGTDNAHCRAERSPH